MDSQHFLARKIQHHLNVIYQGMGIPHALPALANKLLHIMQIDADNLVNTQVERWNESDIVMITYADSIKHQDEKPLQTLHDFMDQHTDDYINNVHILPFFPYSSDDGFSVINFSSVNDALGDWEDIKRLAQDYRIMADLVINHCSSRSQWFDNFKKGISPGQGYFYTVEPNCDLSQVVRPRTSPLLRAVETVNGTEHVWCTFSHDQVDLNFGNPDVLLEFVTIIKHYLDNGIRIFRLDAVGFLWKVPGTRCLSLNQTHEIIRLLRVLIEHNEPSAIIITETNIPNRENLSYFGNGNEAHCIYNFSLPPLLVNTLLTSDCSYLKQWMMSMPPAQLGTTYFNFIASHDGIGLRPAEGLLDEQELQTLKTCLQSFGGKISWHTNDNGEKTAYEINITLFDALQGTVKGPDTFGIDRFLCAHAIMLALEGIPSIYIHSLLATGNDYKRLEHTGHNRAINRHQWNYTRLKALLDDPDSQNSRVFTAMKRLIAIRRQQPAFHPNATQFTLHLGEAVFGFWRQSLDKKQSLFCIYNISLEKQEVLLSDINLIITDDWFDLISGRQFNSISDSLRLKPYQCAWISNQV